ncbi:MAG: hypothetical protein JO210_07935 [Acidobacteriaceae bacterium]|nr:hypothetical protein [Acidobacteriaceae bacterium]
MKSNSVLRLWGAKGAALASLVAASTLAFAQNSSAPASPNQNSGIQQQQSENSSGGWKRVGDQSQVYSPDQNTNNSYPGDTGNSAPNANQQPSYPPPSAPMQQAPQGNQPAYPSPNTGRNGYPPIYSQNGAQQNYQPPPPIPAQLTMPAGTYLTVRVNQLLSSDKNQPGDAFTASLVQPAVVNGVVVAAPGQTLGGRVVTAEKHHMDQPGRLGLQLTNLTLVDGQQVPLNTQFISRQGGTTPGGAEVGTVAATTGVGAAIGAIAGWGTGAAIGAGAGAAAGLIGVLVTHNHASVIYPEQVLTFRLETPVTISTVNSSQAFFYVQPDQYDRPAYPNQGPNGNMYESGTPPPPTYYAYGYGYPYYAGYPYYGGWGWGYPYYWGPSIAFYGGWWGGRYYGGRGYYGGGYYGGRGYYGGGGYYGGARAYAGGARAYAGGARAYGGGASGGHAGGAGGHR